MVREIGSEFWLKEIPPEMTVNFPHWLRHFEFQKLTTLGRGTLSYLLESIETSVTSKNVLLPAYLCESAVNPFIEKGYKCFFYKINQNLEPDLNHFSQLNFAQIGVFFHLGYFGFPTNNNLDAFLTKIKQQGIFVIEDISHTLFSDFNKLKNNDFLIASIRKWAGMPSGGFFSSRLPFPLKKELPLNPSYQQIRKNALLKKGQYVATGLNSLKEEYLSGFREAQKLMDEDNQAYQMDPLSQSIIFNLDYDFIKERRRKNYLTLLEATKDIGIIEPVFKTLPENVTPLFFPVFCAKFRNELRSFLIEKNIFCPIHWPPPKELNLEEFPVSQKVLNTIISIPCDQRYNEEDMIKIVEAIKSFKKGTS